MVYKAVGSCVKYNNKFNELRHEFKVRKGQRYLNIILNPMTLRIRTFIYLFILPEVLTNCRIGKRNHHNAEKTKKVQITLES